MTAGQRAKIEAVLGHRFERPELLERALTHRSHRQNSAGIDNERLEFLGDRVLGIVASEVLFVSFPLWDAGSLSKGLARLVSAASIHGAARKLNLGDFLRLGPG
jgi:ribonuclease-3